METLNVLDVPGCETSLQTLRYYLGIPAEKASIGFFSFWTMDPPIEGWFFPCKSCFQQKGLDYLNQVLHTFDRPKFQPNPWRTESTPSAASLWRASRSTTSCGLEQGHEDVYKLCRKIRLGKIQWIQNSSWSHIWHHEITKSIWSTRFGGINNIGNCQSPRAFPLLTSSSEVSTTKQSGSQIWPIKGQIEN